MVSSSRPVTRAEEAIVKGCSSLPSTERRSRSHTNWPGWKRSPRCMWTGARTRVAVEGPSWRTP